MDRSFTLQPVSIEGETGLNVAAGIGQMRLHFEGVVQDAPPPTQ
jgi:hypothetical protein